jgi:DNA-binding CsgD family transcriptional regulator/tetratricopeptide (TPR) repeat protein
MTLARRPSSSPDQRPLVGKLRPTYPRDRIAQSIREAAAYGIALIVAAAGYGKTEALRHTFGDGSAVIVELDDRIVTIEAFLKKLVRSAVPRHLRGFMALLEKTSADDVLTVLVPWVSSRLRGLESSLVIDDLHRLFRDPRAAIAFQELVESTRHSVTWVLSTRETPDLPIGTWIAREWMHRPITASDLAFREDEALALASVLKINIDVSELAEIVDDTGGWPIALRLSLTTFNVTRARLPTGMRTRDVLYHYIDEQIWQSIDEENRSLLELAAILPQPSVAVLGAAGFPRAANSLDRLSRRLSFVERDDGGEFHLHDIFREFITEQHRRDSSRFDAAVSLVAHALAKLGLSNEALILFTRQKSEENVLAILAQSGYDMIEAGEKETVRGALATLTGRRREEPVACGLRGHLLSLDGAFTAAELEMRRAITVRNSEPFYRLAVRKLAIFLINRSNYAEAIALIEGLLEQNPSDERDRIELHADLAMARSFAGHLEEGMQHAAVAFAGIGGLELERRAEALARIAMAHFFGRQHSQAEAIGNEAATLATQLGLDHLASRVYSLLFAIAEETHQDTARADFYARAMGVAAESAGDRQLRASSLERLLQTATYRADDDAITSVERELASIGQIRTFRDSLVGRVLRVIREVGCGNFRSARKIIEGVNIAELTAAESALQSALLSVCLIADDARDDASRMLSRPFLVQVEPDLYSRRYVSLARAYRALGNWMLGRSTIARRSLAADNVAIGEGDRILIESIASICGTKHEGASEQVIVQLTEPLIALGFAGHARFLRAIASLGYVPIDLTRAEIMFLRSWKTGDTISELARRIGKSPHTVNTQMRAICRKTGTSGRAEALAFARQHGLL